MGKGQGSVMEYCIAEGDCLTDIYREVNALIEDGWKPQGGVVVVHGESMFGDPWIAYYQAMTRE